MRNFILTLYSKASNGAQPRYFLDKTPPYFFVAPEVMEIFPNAKFVFLFRNPLSIVASLIEWDGGRWDPARYKENLFDGPILLDSAYRAAGDRAHAVRYEDLAGGDGDAAWVGVARYLELEYDPATLATFSDVALKGRMGDPFGVERYSELSSEPLTKWRRTLANPLRKAWADRYLRWIGADLLERMGYDLATLRAELDAIPTTTDSLVGDAFRTARSAIKEPLRVRARGSLELGGASALRYVLDPGD